MDKADVQFKQQVLISPTRLFVPDLYSRIFDPDYVPEENEPSGPEGSLGNGEIVHTPTTYDDFERMVAEWEAADAANKAAFNESR